MFSCMLGAHAPPPKKCKRDVVIDRESVQQLGYSMPPASLVIAHSLQLAPLLGTHVCPAVLRLRHTFTFDRLCERRAALFSCFLLCSAGARRSSGPALGSYRAVSSSVGKQATTHSPSSLLCCVIPHVTNNNRQRAAGSSLCAHGAPVDRGGGGKRRLGGGPRVLNDREAQPQRSSIDRLWARNTRPPSPSLPRLAPCSRRGSSSLDQ